MSLVFTQDWIDQITLQYKRRAIYHQPLIFRIATLPEWETERQNVESWVSLLPKELQASVIPRLRSNENFRTTYNELLVGEYLRKLGHDPIYEYALGNQKPDWFVPGTEGELPFFVEVVTVFSTRNKEQEQRIWNELRMRLSEIEHYFDIMVKSKSSSAIHERNLKKITSFINNWLNQYEYNTTKAMHEVTYIDDGLVIDFVLIPRKSLQKSPVGMAGPIFSQRINPDLLRGSISKKVNKYAAAKDQAIALVIAIVPMFSSGFSIYTLIDAVLGKEQISVSNAQVSRDSSGVFAPIYKNGQIKEKNTRLSAIFWLQNRDGFDARVIHNPYAVNRVPISSFPSIPNLMVSEEAENHFILEWVIP